MGAHAGFGSLTTQMVNACAWWAPLDTIRLRWRGMEGESVSAGRLEPAPFGGANLDPQSVRRHFLDGVCDTPPGCGLGIRPEPCRSGSHTMSDVSQALVNMVKSSLGPKKFSTGSTGFFATDKVNIGGKRYQAQAQAVLIGSKEKKNARVEATTEEVTAALAALIEDGGTVERTFKSGKRGYRADGRIQVHGERYQAYVQAVRLN